MVLVIFLNEIYARFENMQWLHSIFNPPVSALLLPFEMEMADVLRCGLKTISPQRVSRTVDSVKSPLRHIVESSNGHIINSTCRYQDMADRQYSHQIVIYDNTCHSSWSQELAVLKFLRICNVCY